MFHENETTGNRAASSAHAELRHRRGGGKAAETDGKNGVSKAENKDEQSTDTVEDAGSGSVFRKLQSLRRESESESRDNDFAGNNKGDLIPREISSPHIV